MDFKNDSTCVSQRIVTLLIAKKVQGKLTEHKIHCDTLKAALVGKENNHLMNYILQELFATKISELQ
jgi:hypothetical protein